MNNARDFKGYEGIFAKRLREVMNDTKTTQEVLAKQTGLTRQTISQYMDGSVLPNAEKLYKICDFFDIPSDYLLGLINSKKKDIPDQYIQSTTGLSDEAIKKLQELCHGSLKPGMLFALPSDFDLTIINYMISDKDFIPDLRKRLIKYYELKKADEANEETDFAKYLLSKLIERLADDLYHDYYKPTFIDRNVKRKPGRVNTKQPID